MMNKQKNSLLHIYTNQGNIKKVKELLEKGENPNTIGKGNYTPLEIACYKGFTDIVQLLLHYNATLHKENALKLAKEYQYKEIIDLLENS
ncbi:MAG: ankyrin repeat domain-containing protein [Leptospiraceae bacterium]|nr:ankyrin repeat domain-containing protein [Leptospiraceae bacterium]